VKDGETRWSLPDLTSALERARERNHQGIRCILSPHGEYSTTVGASQNAIDELVSCAKRIYEERVNASLAVKLTTIGAMFDKQLCRDYLVVLFEDATENYVDLEIDMESMAFVEFTTDVVNSCLANFPLTLSLQAYLDRTRDDIYNTVRRGGLVRLVKGAYSGDISDFGDIQERFIELVEILLLSREEFKIATHDPDIIEWMKKATSNQKKKVEFSFLKGLADATKLDLVQNGWKVSEYVPYGPGGESYEGRRKSYLKTLSEMGRSPVP
jgi:proline dehydrogenase